MTFESVCAQLEEIRAAATKSPTKRKAITEALDVLIAWRSDWEAKKFSLPSN